MIEPIEDRKQQLQSIGLVNGRLQCGARYNGPRARRMRKKGAQSSQTQVQRSVSRDKIAARRRNNAFRH
jgi:hypothetical protein